MIILYSILFIYLAVLLILLIGVTGIIIYDKYMDVNSEFTPLYGVALMWPASLYYYWKAKKSPNREVKRKQ